MMLFLCGFVLGIAGTVIILVIQAELHQAHIRRLVEKWEANDGYRKAEIDALREKYERRGVSK